MNDEMPPKIYAAYAGEYDGVETGDWIDYHDPVAQRKQTAYIRADLANPEKVDAPDQHVIDVDTFCLSVKICDAVFDKIVFLQIASMDRYETSKMVSNMIKDYLIENSKIDINSLKRDPEYYNVIEYKSWNECIECLASRGLLSGVAREEDLLREAMNAIKLATEWLDMETHSSVEKEINGVSEKLKSRLGEKS